MYYQVVTVEQHFPATTGRTVVLFKIKEIVPQLQSAIQAVDDCYIVIFPNTVNFQRLLQQDRQAIRNMEILRFALLVLATVRNFMRLLSLARRWLRLLIWAIITVFLVITVT